MRVGRDAAPAGVVQTTASPGGSWSKPSAAHYGRPSVQDPLKANCRRCRGGAPVGETHPYNASDPSATGLSRSPTLREDLRAIQVTRHLGAPYPSLGGREKEKEIRANPRARIKTGADLLWLFDNRI